MKKILFTQRVETTEDYDERRDCADQNIARFLAACGYLPLPLCNIPELVGKYIDDLEPDGIVLTGGNDLGSYGGNAPERDTTERILTEWALKRNTPLLGFCRGMQFIADFFGAKLVKIDGHTACRHALVGSIEREVNSYHNYGFFNVPQNLEVLAKSEDGVIEAMRHKDKAVIGIMWHPEREHAFSPHDIEMFRRHFSD